jgi:hypothetical protein
MPALWAKVLNQPAKKLLFDATAGLLAISSIADRALALAPKAVSSKLKFIGWPSLPARLDHRHHANEE